MNFQVYVTFLSSRRIFLYQLEVKTGFLARFSSEIVGNFSRNLQKSQKCALKIAGCRKNAILKQDRVDVGIFGRQ